MGQNQKHTSECFMQEIVLAIGEATLEPIKEETQNSPVFSLLVDETTDVSIIKQMIVYGCYISNGETKTQFLGIVKLSDGRAVTIDAVQCMQHCKAGNRSWEDYDICDDIWTIFS